MDGDWRVDLERWLAPYLEGLGHKARQRMCPAYVAGLIGPGDRKSIQPMAARTGEVGYDRLHHFIGAGLWDSGPLEATLWEQADALVGGDKAWLIIDDTALPKKGTASVGVAPQYASALGKNANCQTLVSVTLASREVPIMLGLRLFLPESWTSDEARMVKAGVPEPFRPYRTKPAIAIEEIDRVIAAGVRFGCVLADAGYGLSASFRQGLSTRGLHWAVGIPRHQKVYPADVQLIFPVAGRGRPRQHHVPDTASRAAHAVLDKLGEDELKVTIVLKPGAELDAETLCRWCVDHLPYYAVPRYFEFRDDFPRSPVGRILKYELRDQGVTPATWDREKSDIKLNKR